MKSYAKLTGFLAATLIAAPSLMPTPSFGHSPMFDDYFKFDESNGGGSLSPAMQSIIELDGATADQVRCVGGSAAGYPCEKIDLQAFVAKANMGGANADLNDIWGWTDPLTGSEIAIVGLTDGTSFVDITDPVNPVYLGKLPSHNGGVDSWRDVKVYRDHAFVVADGNGNSTHGLQVFDLTKLRNVTIPPALLAETGHLGTFGNAHNIVINEDTGFAYVVGSNQCSAGLLIVDISTPNTPRNAGCFSQDGYVHDAQCVIYTGPDSRYSNREICFGYNEDTLTIVDVTNKRNPVQVSRTPYPGSQYTHQGWLLDERQEIVIMNDELDEIRAGVNTTSFVWNVSNLRSPRLLGNYRGPTPAIDHNLYTRDGYVFESNYRAGLRILSTDDIASGNLEEVAHFDVIPGSNSAQFSGSWSSYIYFESGNIVVSDIGGGLFVLRPDWDAINGGGGEPTIAVRDAAVGEGDGTVTVNVGLSAASRDTVEVTAFTRRGTAINGKDYYGQSQRLMFQPGERVKKLSITILDDSESEDTENFSVHLINPDNATISDGEATVSIRDNEEPGDPRPVISVQNIRVDESVGQASFDVNLSKVSRQEVTAKVYTRAGTARGGSDYYGFTRTIRFAPGQTRISVPITILDDDVAERTESLGLRLAVVTNAVVGEFGSVTIRDDD